MVKVTAEQMDVMRGTMALKGLTLTRLHRESDREGLIFVVDSSDIERAEVAREEICSLAREPELQDVKLLIFANKQDLPNAMTTAEARMNQRFWTGRQLRAREWHVQPTNAVTGEGLMEGLEWLHHSVVIK
ncbi:hypothetical protein OSTOST_20128 [Ostertagia ostertagi]